MEAWIHQLLHTLSLPEFGLSTVFVVALISATLLPMGSEPVVFGLVKLNPELFWPAVVVATHEERYVERVDRCIALRDGVLVHKLPSTPSDPSQAVLRGVDAVRRTPAEPVDVVHGTTVGLNAVLTGNLARTAFVTNAGCEDLIEIGRQERADLYALAPHRAVPPVPRGLRVGARCRRGPGGVARGRPGSRLGQSQAA